MKTALVRVIRGDTVESLHRAHVVAADPRGRVVARAGDPAFVTFLRSSAKPLQQIPLLETGAADAFRFTPPELAVSVGSHNGDDIHVRLIEGILSRIGLSTTDLRCGAHAPYGAEAARRVGNDYSALHHNCSGKHAAMLAACVHNGWDTATYQDPKHPLQRRILAVVGEETGLSAGQVAVAIDGCGVPTFALPLRAAARAFARLSAPEGIEGERGRTLRRVRDAMLAHPHLVAGEDRIDTRIMRAAPGRVWVKAGAEACYGVGLVGAGLGAVVKVEDGSARGMAPLLVGLLEALLPLSGKERASLRAIDREPLRNVAGGDVGRLEAQLTLTGSVRTRGGSTS